MNDYHMEHFFENQSEKTNMQTSNSDQPNQPTEISQEESESTTRYIINKFKRLERERKDWKKLAKSMYVVLGRVRKPHPKKLLEKYLQIKHKYRKSW